MTDSTENITELFFSKLKTAPNAGVVLAQFYGTVMGLEVGRSEIIKLNKLTKLFGKTSVFFAIVDVSRIETPTEFPYGLLFKICKTKLERVVEIEMSTPSMYSLDKRIADLEKELAKVKKIDPDKAGKYLGEETKDVG
jgi:hypothetical protein